MNNRLYVGNLPYDVTTEGLSACFSEFGTVTDTHVVKERETGRVRGFAFVTMQTADEANHALAQLNNRLFEGRTLHVNIAEERTQHGAGRRSRSGENHGW